jgi:predicted ABC-type ATPase
MTTFKDFILSESIEDAGIFKAIFVTGIPGAGKTHTVRHLQGKISPRVVNTDRATEFLAKKLGKQSHPSNWEEFKDSAHRITAGGLYNYLNGVLPLFIDGTSNNVSNILHRAGILESLGYDIGMVFVNAPLELAIKRAKDRAATTGRDVETHFIKKVHAQAEENKEYFKSKFAFFKEVDNREDMLSNDVLQDAFKKVQGFYESPLSNPVGKRMKQRMIDKRAKYLVPEILEKEVLRKKLEGWYKD